MTRLFQILLLITALAVPPVAQAGKPGGGGTTNQAPRVFLTWPGSGVTVEPGSDVRLEAEAFDGDGSVARVEFYRGTTLIGTVTSPPYAVLWPNAPAGIYSLSAKATDNAGAVATSNAVSLAVATPGVTVSAPSNGAVIYDNAVTLTGTYTGTAVNVLADNGATTRLAALSGNTFSVTLPLDPGANPLTVSVVRSDKTAAITTLTVTRASPPVITFTAPTINPVDAPANLSLAVDAVSPGSSLSKVEFFKNGAPLGTSLAAPYGYHWTNVPAGSYTLSAKATDANGQTGVATLPVSVLGPNILPAVALTAPGNGAVFTAPATIALAASASDPDGSITQVAFLRDGAALAGSNVAPYGFNWTNVPVGSYVLTAEATDNRGGTTASAPVGVTVTPPNNPPAVNLISPASGAVFSGPATIALAATAADADGSITKVEFLSGSTLIGTATAAPYAFSWMSVAAGSYSLSAKATDNLGAVTVTPPVSVTVNPLEVAIAGPADGATLSGRRVVVSGSFIGPANTGITVNGHIAAQDGNNHFYAEVPLAAGSNPITATLTTPSGETRSASLTVVSDGVAPTVEIIPDHLEGIAPLTVVFSVRNNGAGAASVTMNGGAPLNLEAGASGIFTANLTAPPVYPVTATVIEASGTTTQSFVIVVQDPAKMDLMFKGLWSGMTEALIGGDKATAMNYLSAPAQAKYGPVFETLMPNMTQILGTWSTPALATLAGEIAEYSIITTRNDGRRLHLIYFARDADGVWRLNSM